MKKIIKREPCFLELAEQDFLKWQLESDYSEEELCHYHQAKRLLDVYDNNEPREKQKKRLAITTTFLACTISTVLVIASLKGEISENKMRQICLLIDGGLLSVYLLCRYILNTKQKRERDYYISKLTDISYNFSEIEIEYQKALENRGLHK